LLFSSGNNTNTWSVGYGYSDDNFRINQDHGYHNGGWGTTRFSADRSGNLFAGAINSNKIWHAGNDGSGSGLDADTLRGVSGDNFLRKDIEQTMSANIKFANSGTAQRGIQGTCGDNDFWFFGGGATSSNAGYVEIAAGDDGTTYGSYEPIYVRQYLGAPLTGSVQRTLTLLSNYGDTIIPNQLEAQRVRVANISNQAISNSNITSRAASNSGGTVNYHMRFIRPDGASNGHISTNYYATTYATTSDYRAKEDVQPMAEATSRLMALNPVNFQWKDSDMRTDGFLAHEVAEIVSDAVVGEKDATEVQVDYVDNEDGSRTEVESVVDSLQALDQAKLVPLLVKTIQEQQAAIEALEARIANLES
jgi:hypothetical protein